eukprot:15420738-Alexandrium_andersonii.AAC.1
MGWRGPRADRAPRGEFCLAGLTAAVFGSDCACFARQGRHLGPRLPAAAEPTRPSSDYAGAWPPAGQESVAE